MRAPLDGRLRILADALQLANKRAMEAAGVADPVDDLTGQQLRDMAHALAQMELAVWDTHAEIYGVSKLTDDQRDPAAAAGDYSQERP